MLSAWCKAANASTSRRPSPPPMNRNTIFECSRSRSDASSTVISRAGAGPTVTMTGTSATVFSNHRLLSRGTLLERNSTTSL